MNAHQRRRARRAAKRKSAREIVAAKILIARFRAAYPKVVDFFSEFSVSENLYRAAAAAAPQLQNVSTP